MPMFVRTPRCAAARRASPPRLEPAGRPAQPGRRSRSSPRDKGRTVAPGPRRAPRGDPLQRRRRGLERDRFAPPRLAPDVPCSAARRPPTAVQRGMDRSAARRASTRSKGLRRDVAASGTTGGDASRARRSRYPPARGSARCRSRRNGARRCLLAARPARVSSRHQRSRSTDATVHGRLLYVPWPRTLERARPCLQHVSARRALRKCGSRRLSTGPAPHGLISSRAIRPSAQ
jgi:hypothetical protein